MAHKMSLLLKCGAVGCGFCTGQHLQEVKGGFEEQQSFSKHAGAVDRTHIPTHTQHNGLFQGFHLVVQVVVYHQYR